MRALQSLGLSLTASSSLSLFLLGSVVHSQDSSQDWSDRCEAIITSAYESKQNGTAPPSQPWPELVAEYGVRAPGLNLDNAWGISVEECYRSCYTIKSEFSFAHFSASFTNWLLPWLSLLSQLPFETDGPFNNLMSVLLAVGSPALITYSLVITIFARSRIAERFEELERIAENSPIKRVYHQFITRLKYACYILQESQQAPMRAWEGNGWLSSLVVLEENQGWWECVKKNLASTRRGVTTSLVAQLLFAVVAWLFTIIAAFESVGDVTTALSISASSVWLWMLPVITGWVGVGTQADKGTIVEALGESNLPRCFRAQPRRKRDRTVPPPKGGGSQDGIRSVSGLLAEEIDKEERERRMEQYHRHGSVNGMDPERQSSSSNTSEEASKHIGLHHLHRHHHDQHDKSTSKHTDPGGIDNEKSPVSPSEPPIGPLSPASTFSSGPGHLRETADLSPAKAHAPSIWSISLSGHESEEGPMYNYARVFTLARFVETVTRGFEGATHSMASGRTPTPGAKLRDTTEEKGAHEALLSGDLAGTAGELNRFCGYDVDNRSQESYMAWSDVPRKVWRHMLVAGAMALFVQWGTTGPSVLMGLLTPTQGLGCRSGSYIMYGCAGTVVFLLLATASLISHALMLRHQRGRPVGRILPAVFVCCKSLGSVLASLNAIWLVLSSVFELSGVFSSCFCSSDYIGLRGRGWVLLFKQAEDLAADAESLWIGSIAFGAAVCVLSCVFVWLGCKNKT